RFLILTLLLTLQLLSGHAQSTFYTLLLAGAWITWHSLSLGPTTNRPLRPNYQSLIINLFFFALALLFALALAAIQLIPTYELLSQSPRADAAEYEFAMTYSLWPWRLLSWIIPNLFGHPADHNYWGYATYWEDNAYLGLLPLVFALYAAYRVSRIAYHVFLSRLTSNTRYETRDTSAFVSLISLSFLISFISIILAFGQNTPIFPFFYRYIPGFGLFQAPARMLIWFTFAASLLAGIGAHHWQASERKRYWSRLGIVGSLAMFTLGIAGYLAIDNARAEAIGSGLSGAAVLALGVFILLLAQPASPDKWRWAALTLLAADLGLAAVRLNPTIDPVLYHLRPSTIPTTRAYQFAEDEHHVKFREFFRFTSFDDIGPQSLRDAHLPNLNVLNGVASANNFDPLLSARYVTFVKAMEQNQRLFGLANVHTLIKRAGAITALDNGDAAPFRIIHQSRTVANGEAALAAINDPAFDPATEVILEPVEPERYGWPLEPNRTVITYSGEAGYVMLADTYYPGWRVLVDGVEQPILRANYAFKAVAVPAGTHEVVFEFAPFSVTLGLIISVSALSVWVVLLGVK
ncbi:MAG TPA: YfhO family protein, partial [Anaerolineales bacterium]|nr:YfhO family protein [Anaerolineales bacterium]